MHEARILGMVLMGIYTVAFCIVMADAAVDAFPVVWEWIMQKVDGVLS